jgi:hypothetical protein
MNRCLAIPDEFWPLLDAACDGDLSPAQRLELEKLLDENQNARHAFVDHIRLRTLIRLGRKGQRACEAGLAKIETLGAGGRTDKNGPDSEDVVLWKNNLSRDSFSAPPNSAPIPSIVIQSDPSVYPSNFNLNTPLGSMLFSYALSAMLVCLGMLIGWTWTISEPQPMTVGRSDLPPAVNKNAPQPVAKMLLVGRITGLADCVFSSDRDILPPPSSHAYVPMGRKYKLNSGLMEITYDTGAKIILQGPVTFEVDSTNGGFLWVGKLTAKVEKKVERLADQKSSTRYRQSSSPLSPLPAPLFSVRTPTAIVTDLGTEFGVECDKSGATLSHVFRGSVKMQLSPNDADPSDQTVVLGENESGRVEKTDGRPLTIQRSQGEAGDYVRSMPPPKHVTESSAYSQLVLSMHPAVYFRMERPKSARDKLRVLDSATGNCTGDLFLANEFGRPWGPGRFGDSLYFRGPEVGDHVFVPDYPKAENDQLTVSAWVLAETRPYYSMIAANWGGSAHPEPNITGQFHFGLCGTDGDLAIQMTQHDGKCVEIREGASDPLPVGIWQHVAFVADGKTIRLYRNGVEVASAAANGIVPKPPMQSMSIGCKTDDTGKRVSPNISAYWQGWIDEVAVFNAALSPDAIRKLSETPNKQPGSAGWNQGKNIAR